MKKTTRYTGWVWVLALALGAGVTACSLGDGFGSDRQALDCMPSDPNALVFEQAVCLCGSLDKVGSGLTTSGFSSFGRREDTPRLAHVGINGTVDSVGSLKIDGTLDVAGYVRTVASVMIKQDLFVGSDLTTTGHMSVDYDAYVAGDIIGCGQLEVGGGLAVGGSVAMTGNLKCDNVSTDVAFEPHLPCACDPEDLIDVAAEVAAHSAAQPLAIPGGTGHREIVLTEGDYYAQEGGFLRGNTRIKVEGAVRLFIDGDVELVGSGFVELAEGAELDLYIAGTVKKIGNLQVGWPHKQPASRAIRTYIGGSDEVALDVTGNTRFMGAVYAPMADIHYRGNLIIEGALFARNLVGVGHVLVRYDAGLVGEGCDPDPDGTGDGDDLDQDDGEDCIPGDDTNPCPGDNGYDDGDGDNDGDVDGDGDGDVDGDGDADGDGDTDGDGDSGCDPTDDACIP